MLAVRSHVKQSIKRRCMRLNRPTVVSPDPSTCQAWHDTSPQGQKEDTNREKERGETNRTRERACLAFKPGCACHVMLVLRKQEPQRAPSAEVCRHQPPQNVTAPKRMPNTRLPANNMRNSQRPHKRPRGVHGCSNHSGQENDKGGTAASWCCCDLPPSGWQGSASAHAPSLPRPAGHR